MSKYLHKEGNWYLLSKEQATGIIDVYGYNSFIWHQCPADTGSYGGCWRVTRKNLNLDCGLCKEACPDNMQGLWTMLNMDIEGD